MTPASIRKTMTLTVEKAKSLFRYDESTGLLSWRYRKGKKVPRNLAAGYIDSEGYRVVRADGVNYRAHRIVWLMSFGRWPTHMLDHVNGDRADNRLSNLREATNSQNQMNKKRQARGASGYKGVAIIRRRGRIQYRPGVTLNGKHRVFGYYDDPREAYEVYCREAVRAFGPFAKL